MSDFFILDTNTLLSAALFSNSTSRKALNKAIELGRLAVSNSTFAEVIDVLFRKKFDKYFFDNNERWVVLNKIEINAVLFIPDFSITDCRDPKDNKFLELAISANASCLISVIKICLCCIRFVAFPF